MKIKMMMKGIAALIVLLFVFQVFAPITAVLAATESISTAKYEVKDGTIMRVAAGTTVSQFLTNIVSDSGAVKEVYSGNTQVTENTRLSTGMVLKVGTTTYRIAVRGDANGDGELTATDLSQFKMNYTGIRQLSSPYLEAVDINYDGQITTVDLSQLKMLLVGLGYKADDENASTESLSFNFDYVHKISNYIYMSGDTTDAQTGVSGYQFSYDNGSTWYPQVAQDSLDYTLVTVPEDSTANLKIKTKYDVGNSTTTASKEQRTFTEGIKLLKDKLGEGVTVNEANSTITLPNGKMYKLAITENGSYNIYPLTISGQETIDPMEANKINDAILKFEQTGTRTTEEVLNELQKEGFGTASVDAGLLVVEKEESYVTYEVVEIAGGKHEARFSRVILKSGQTESMKATEQNTLQQVTSYLGTKTTSDKISDILNQLVANGTLQQDNINPIRGTFETEAGTVYKIILNGSSTGYTYMDLDIAENVNDQLIVLKMLDVLKKGLISQIIDWEIADGITTEYLANRQSGVFRTVDGQAKLVNIDFTNGTYSISDIAIADNSYTKLEYSLSPDFPTVTDTTKLTITSIGGTGSTGIAKVQVFSEIGDVLYSKDYDPESTPSATDTLDLTYNGIYMIVLTDGNGTQTIDTVTVANISTIDPIKATTTPETARNTVAIGKQNGVDTGPITVTLKYGEAATLKNSDKYQYQIVPIGGTISDTAWVTVPVQDRQAVITGIVDNCTIYARYYDGEKSRKQLKVDVNNVDNVSPDPFEFTTTVTSHSIAVNVIATDTAADSKGNPSKNGVAEVTGYLYKIDNGNWMSDGDWDNEELAQGTTHTVSVKAIDGAGNETPATNNGQSVTLLTVPNAKDILTINCDPSSVTKDGVTATFDVKSLADTSNLPNGVNQDGTLNSDYVTQYQVAPLGTENADPNGDWYDGSGCTVIANCVIFVRIIDITGQIGNSNGYLRGEVTNIDNVGPELSTLNVTDKTQTSITVKLEAQDTDGGIGSAVSGIDKYEYSIAGTVLPLTTATDITTNTYTFTGLDEGRTYSIIVAAIDKAGNKTQSGMIEVQTAGTPLDENNPGALGIDKFNEGPGNVTVNGADSGFYNPVVPVGFKAINIIDNSNHDNDIKWNGTGMAQGYDKGLVIEDRNGSQFVWVPVDGNAIQYSSMMDATEELPTSLQNLGVDEQKQIELYGGFYVSRYEAGNDDGILASKQGLKPENGVTYDEAKTYAESMYSNQSVKSGLLTGTAWDTMMAWIGTEKGSSYLTNNVASGNNINNSFAIKGWYSVGPSNTGEKRGAWVQGSYTKPAGQACLAGTGSSEDFKMKNIYDLAGNVWEYTYATMKGDDGKDYRVVRGGDYFSPIDEAGDFGAASINLIPMDSKKQDRNESGFRVMLYLVEGTALMNDYADYNRTMSGKASNYNNPVIPAGFTALADGGDWTCDSKGAVKGYNDGLVIGDKAGNEFVWVPVWNRSTGTWINDYAKWIERGETYSGTTDDSLPSKVLAWGDRSDEKDQIQAYGGFYVARYETSKDMSSGTATAASKSNAESWTNISYTDAKAAAESVSTKQYVSAGLITGTQWDTVMQWISTDPSIWINGVINDSTSWGNYSNSTLGKNAKAKNIFELAGGDWEWTTEKNSSGQSAYRGGVSTDRGDSSPAGYRGFTDGSTLDGGTTFRMVLYIDGDVKEVLKKPVEEKPALLATFANLTAHYLWASDDSYGTVYVGPYFPQLSDMFPGIRDSDKDSMCVALIRKKQPTLVMDHYFYWGATGDYDYKDHPIEMDDTSVTCLGRGPILVLGNSARDAGESICPYKDESSILGDILRGVGIVVGCVIAYFCPPLGAAWLAGVLSVSEGVAGVIIAAAAMAAATVVSNEVGGTLGQILGAVVQITITCGAGAYGTYEDMLNAGLVLENEAVQQGVLFSLAMNTLGQIVVKSVIATVGIVAAKTIGGDLGVAVGTALTLLLSTKGGLTETTTDIFGNEVTNFTKILEGTVISVGISEVAKRIGGLPGMAAGMLIPAAVNYLSQLNMDIGNTSKDNSYLNSLKLGFTQGDNGKLELTVDSPYYHSLENSTDGLYAKVNNTLDSLQATLDQSSINSAMSDLANYRMSLPPEYNPYNLPDLGDGTYWSYLNLIDKTNDYAYFTNSPNGLFLGGSLDNTLPLSLQVDGICCTSQDGQYGYINTDNKFINITSPDPSVLGKTYQVTYEPAPDTNIFSDMYDTVVDGANVLYKAIANGANALYDALTNGVKGVYNAFTSMLGTTNESTGVMQNLDGTITYKRTWLDNNGNPILDNNGNPIMEPMTSVDGGKTFMGPEAYNNWLTTNNPQLSIASDEVTVDTSKFCNFGGYWKDGILHDPNGIMYKLDFSTPTPTVLVSPEGEQNWQAGGQIFQDAVTKEYTIAVGTTVTNLNTGVSQILVDGEWKNLGSPIASDVSSATKEGNATFSKPVVITISRSAWEDDFINGLTKKNLPDSSVDTNGYSGTSAPSLENAAIIPKQTYPMDPKDVVVPPGVPSINQKGRSHILIPQTYGL